MRSESLVRFAIAAACLPAFGTLAYGGESVRYDLQIERQSLGSALQEFARQSGVQIIFFSKVTDGYEAPSLNGKFTAAAALGALLNDSQLTFQELNPNTIEVKPKAAVNDLKTGLSRAAAEVSTARFADASAGGASRAGAFRLARADGRSRSGSLATDDEDSGEDSTLEELDLKAIPEMLVVGSRILNADIRRTEDDAQPYMVFERADLERSGARNVEDFLARRLTASTSSSTASQSGGVQVSSDGILGNTSSIDLRGLGQDETLVLIDGRRIAGFSMLGVPRQGDINGIPLAAIERIEVLPTTASGIYGGGATGGVVNIVLRRDYSGVDVKLTYDGTFDGGAEKGQIDLSAGFPLEEGRTSVLFTASYSDASELRFEDRDLQRRGIERFLANNPGGILGSLPWAGATTNITSTGQFNPATGTSVRPNLTLDNGTSLGSPITFVPGGYAGPASDNGAGMIANAGQYNFNLSDTAGGGRAGLVNAPTVKSFLGSVRRQFTSWLDGYLELARSENDGSFPRGVSAGFEIPGNAPANPFQQRIRVNTPIFGTDSAFESSLKSDRAAAGAIVDLPGDWRAQADYTWNRTRLSYLQPSSQLDSTAAAAAIASGALDIFRDTSGGTVDFSPYLGNEVDSTAETSMDNVALRFGGPLPLSLPGGAPMLSMLLEYRKEEIDDQIVTTQPMPPFAPIDVLIPSRSQSVNSAYLELRLPVVAEGNAVPGMDLLELQLAGRWDDYETSGTEQGIPLVDGVPVIPVVRDTNRFDSVNPTFGVRYKPVSDVMLRASYGTGFLPANVAQLVAAPPTLLPPFILGILGLTDARRGGEPLGATGQSVLVTGGGNSDLDPEESESWSAGLVLTPRFAPGLRISADWTRIEKTDNIGVLIPTDQANLDLELLIPGMVTRDQDPATFGPFGVGPIVALDGRLRNIALTDIEAYDFAADYRWATDSFGEFLLSAAATHFVHNEVQSVPQAPVVENAGTINGVEWRGNVTLSWDYKGWTAAWTTRHFDSYRLYPLGSEVDAVILAQGSASVPDQTYHDFFASYRFGPQPGMGLLSGVEIQLGVNNVFNTRPPVDLTHQGVLYSSLGDPRLASYYISLRKSF